MQLEIVNSIIEYSNSLIHQPLKNFSAFVTAGPTREKIDPVRFISNESSGKQGYAIAQSLFNMGAKTTLITGPTNIPLPEGPSIIKVNTAEEMLDACEQQLPADIAICSAAVSDYRVNNKKNSKIKKTGENISLDLSENPDILNRISKRNANRPSLVIGFAAETGELERDLKLWVRKQIGPLATPDLIHFSPGLPKTRSGKIMRRILRKIAANEHDQLGDTTTLADPSVVESLVDNRKNI